jgi:hypothetical protein
MQLKRLSAFPKSARLDKSRREEDLYLFLGVSNHRHSFDFPLTYSGYY